jgi:thymidylate synthase
MQNYLDLLQDVLDNGFEKTDRTGVGSVSVFGRTLRWDLSKGFPIITTRKVSLRIAFEETMFFLRGERDTKKLEEKKINIWKGNTTREFLDSRGLTWLEEGDMGYGYSHQWRNFGGVDGELHQSTIMTDFIGNPWPPFVIPPTPGVDQIQKLVVGLKKDPYSRRHLVTAWNPAQVDLTPLPPCHILHQYQVTPTGKLNSCFIMRSNDVPYGLPYNIMGYAFINAALAKLLGYESGELVYFGGDVHIYNNQIPMAREQLKRKPHPLPTLIIKRDLNTLDDLLDLQYNDLELQNYVADPDFKDKPPMAV